MTTTTTKTTSRLETLLSVTIAALGLGAAYGTWAYLARFLTTWPAVLCAGAIECAYVCLALLPAKDEDSAREARSTALTLVWASIAFNLGHAYEVAVPGGLSSGTARLDVLALVQALVVSSFVPWIAFRIARVRATGMAGASAAPEQERGPERDLGPVNEDVRPMLSEPVPVPDPVTPPVVEAVQTVPPAIPPPPQPLPLTRGGISK
jgi:hypothetical protein